ncbi:YlmC/YmxH family sporulation protein [Mahella sp.]|uniref:YlmC/YmxH family sporulation protein n=1 Tax=Mahella sp. TaxID=2798721 RepID=UPI0025C0E22E|nr:YlmC/YmxH family sporulation protein [Mahella sp.]MBZ4666096.1 sporulation protein YlmC/YmxH family [Mahella sp.]
MDKSSDIRQKEVVNVLDGKRLGPIVDMEFDLEAGRITAIIVPGNNKFNIFGKSKEYIIPWEKIKKIGQDVILVEFNEGIDEH